MSSGYASFDYEEISPQVSDLVKVQILLNGEPVDALSLITHTTRAFERGKSLCKKLKEVIPRWGGLICSCLLRVSFCSSLFCCMFLCLLYSFDGLFSHVKCYIALCHTCSFLTQQDRQLYDIAIQASAKNKVIARETVKALRKDVTAKCYGGDITRKRKLLSRQKEGKKKMKVVGSVQLPKVCPLASHTFHLLTRVVQEAFLTVLNKK